MQARRVRVEFIRFSLLVVLTIGLISVAARYNDGGSDNRATAQPSTSASPSSGGGSGTSGGSGSPAPADGGSPSTGTTGSSGAGTGSEAGSASGTDSEASGNTDDGSVDGVAELPRTGPAQTAELAALALLFIGWGGVSLTLARRRRPQRITRSR